jgi:hypothetical protein
MKVICTCAESEGLCVTCGHFPEMRKDGDAQVMAREGKVKTVNASCIIVSIQTLVERQSESNRAWDCCVRPKPNGEGPDRTEGGCGRSRRKLRVR